jgi:hypothetical protein
MCLREKIGPDPRNFNQRVSLGRNDLLIRTFLSIQVDVSARTLPFRINNCLYLVLNSEQEFSVMVSAESFGELRLFRYRMEPFSPSTAVVTIHLKE